MGKEERDQQGREEGGWGKVGVEDNYEKTVHENIRMKPISLYDDFEKNFLKRYISILSGCFKKIQSLKTTMLLDCCGAHL